MKRSGYPAAIFWGAVMLAAGLLLSAAAAWKQSQHNAKVVTEALSNATDRVVDDISDAVTLYQYGLRGARGAIVTVGETGITRALFHRYSATRNIAKEFPGANNFGFIRRVPAQDKETFIQRARADGAPDFAIRQIAPHDGDLYVIQYSEPATANTTGLNLDIASEPDRKAAADLAMRSGEATMTAPVVFVNSPDGGRQSFLLLMPVYRSDAPVSTEDERVAAAVGWTHTALSTQSMLAPLKIDTNALRLKLTDVTSPDSPIPFYETGNTARDNPNAIAQRRDLDIFGRRWQIETFAKPLFVNKMGLPQPSSVLAVGAAMSILFACLVAVFNIGQQQRRRAALEQKRLATIVENSSDPIIGEALDGSIISWNKAAERVFGYREEEALGAPLAQLLVPPERWAEDRELLDHVAQDQALDPFDTVRMTRDGRLIDVSIAVGVIREPDGSIAGVAKILRDVGARKEDERRKAEFQQQLEQQVRDRTADLNRINILLGDVLRSASEVSIIATDVDGTIRIFNTGAERMLGYSAEEVVGKHTPALLHVPDEVRKRGAALSAAYGIPIEGFRVFIHIPEIEGSETREWTYVRKDGSMFRISLVATAMRDSAGRITGYLGIAEDITERLRSLTALQEAKIAAESANVAKSQFLAMMSHELRTPMTGILGIADLLLASKLHHEQRDQLLTLTRSAQTLLDLLNDILDFAKIEAGRIDLEQVDFSLSKLVDDIGAVIAPLASERGNNIKIEIDSDLLPAYRGDAKRYRQILINLAGNANKFTANGTVTISLRQRATDDGRYMIETRVADTGVGISPENHERLFQPFVQADASTSRKFGGTGLGLAICKRLVVLMGGTIDVESEPGKGSSFNFTVNLAAGDASKVEHVSGTERRSTAALFQLPTSSSPARVLVAEDNETNRMLLVSILSRAHHIVDAVENGALAVSAVRDNPYDIVIMDMQMPVMDGEEATRAIRAGGGAVANIPVIALTADALRENHTRYMASGVNMVLTKPVDWQALVSAIGNLVREGSSQNPVDAAAAPEEPAYDDLPLLDTELIGSYAAYIDGEQLQRLADGFLTSVATYLSEIAALPGDVEPDRLKKIAHGLRGITAQFGAKRLSDIARRIEEGSAKGRDVSEFRAALPDAAVESMATLRHWLSTQPSAGSKSAAAG